ncbi:MAG: L7Ae/L30e/S12e/Gadd45 family ribosomal protein [Candidatus Wallacebacter cryptica]|jgi:ribosomal protein L7Ae-like RNA K-turn-binding protein|nr:50S ribosomal protein L7ae [Bacillota bacterium]
MDKVFSLLGFAQRSGKAVSGEQGVMTALHRGKVHCLIVAKDSSQNTLRKFSAKAAAQNVPVYVCGTKLELGLAIGKAQRSLIAVIDSGFARAIASELGGQNLSWEKD